MHAITRHDLLGIIIAVSAFFILLILYVSKRNRTYSNNSGQLNYSGQAYSREHLEKMVLGDKAVAQRLIVAERSLRPNNSEKDLIKLAVERLIRDNR